MQNVNFEIVWKRVCLKYETFNIVAFSQPAILPMLCLHFHLVDVASHVALYGILCDEELLRIAARLLLRHGEDGFFSTDDGEFVSRSETAMNVLHKAKLKKSAMDT